MEILKKAGPHGLAFAHQMASRKWRLPNGAACERAALQAAAFTVLATTA
jgi:hypothetical protein